MSTERIGICLQRKADLPYLHLETVLKVIIVRREITCCEKRFHSENPNSMILEEIIALKKKKSHPLQ